MHFHLPKPLHGWRAFAGEVGIIVLGVLIALGADQAVEDWVSHQGPRLEQFRNLIDRARTEGAVSAPMLAQIAAQARILLAR